MSWGNNIKFSLFGESHGEAIGCVIENLPAGITLDFAQIENEMARRAPGQNSYSTSRREPDKPEILSGLKNNTTTGFPLACIIHNTNTRSGDYNTNVMRPGHADYTAFCKYNGFADMHGGGHFSGRLTAPIVFAGAVAKQVLVLQTANARIADVQTADTQTADVRTAIDITARIVEIAGIKDDWDAQQAAILDAKKNGNSVGGIIEGVIEGFPKGFGEPFFGSIESVISSFMFAIPAIKGVEFGDGFEVASKLGSDVNDEIYYNKNGDIEFSSNHSGGINGGISNGQPIVCRVAFRPTPTIAKEQKTIDIDKKENIIYSAKGRHDPCIVPRAVVVVEAGLALCALDLLRGEL